MRARTAVAFLLALAAAMGGCDEHTVAIRFDPDVGDRYRFRSEVTTEVARTLDGETTVERDESVLDATELVVAVDDEEIRLDVTLARDGATQRSYEVRVDRGDRLTAIDLVEGVPADALGLDVITDLPADIASPPAEPLEPGARWAIERTLAVDDENPVTVDGWGRVESLGVVDGHDVAVIIVELRLPVRRTIDTVDGVVTVEGVQTSRSRTTYDLDEGAARSDDTEIRGEIDVLVRPPADIEAAPVSGRILYEVTTRTTRVPGDRPGG